LVVADHPVLVVPDERRQAGAAAVWGCSVREAGLRLLLEREKGIEGERGDPLRNGYEPPIWHVADALIDFPFCAEWVEERIKARTGLGWDGFKTAMREALGFRKKVRMLLIQGGQRAGKSEYSAKRGQMLLERKPGARVYWAHMSAPRSVKDQQPLIWKYMPPEWRVQRKESLTYIAYKRHTGFSGSAFITPLSSEGAFFNYSMDRSTAIEGIEPDAVFPDELIPQDWVETLAFRLTTRTGFLVVGFTPVFGYTPTVQLWVEGAEAVRENVGFMLPIDGGERDEGAALNLSREELAENVSAAAAKPVRPRTAPGSVPEDCYAWLDGWLDGPGGVPRGQRKEGRFGWGKSGMDGVEGRQWERVPRVLRCVDERKAVVYFHSTDNPYGNPRDVAEELRSRSGSWVRERFYGWAQRTARSVFPRFSRSVHVVKAREIPGGGMNVMCCDPAGDRNYWMQWLRRTPDGRLWIYREWPGSYWVPGVGVPGAWAIPSGRKGGMNDGDRGEGQEGLGWGLVRYKFEVARLERWAGWRRWAGEQRERMGEMSDEEGRDEEVAEWDEEDGAEERIEIRFLDSRAASDPKVENDVPETLLTKFGDIGLEFELAPGGLVSEGVSAINDLLDWDEGRAPGLVVSEECRNTIYALENYRGVEGQRGAMKDCVDTIRWAVMGETEFDDGEERSRGGVSYGRRRGGWERPEGVPGPRRKGEPWRRSDT
jgi:hypothetical protein